MFQPEPWLSYWAEPFLIIVQLSSGRSHKYTGREPSLGAVINDLIKLEERKKEQAEQERESGGE